MPGTFPDRPASPGELAAMAFACLAAALASLSIHLAEGVPMAWFGTPLLAAFLMSRARGSWPAILAISVAAGLAAGLTLGSGLVHTLTAILAGIAEASLAALLARRLTTPDDILQRPAALFRLLIGCAVLAPLASATLSTLAHAWSEGWRAQSPAAYWTLAYLYAAALQAGLAPALTALLAPVGIKLLATLRRPRTQAFMLLVAVVTTLVLTLRAPAPFAFVAAPLLLAIALTDLPAMVILVAIADVLSVAFLPHLAGPGVNFIADGHAAWVIAELALRMLVFLPIVLSLSAAIDLARQRESLIRTSEETVRGLSARLGMATRAGKIGFWDVDIQRGEVQWDEQMYDQYWMPPGQRVTDELWRARVHPEDLPMLEAEMRATVRDGGASKAEFRIVGPHGQQRMLHVVYSVLRGADGRTEHIVGLSWDITREREYEQAIARNHEELQVIIDHIPGMVGYWDHELRNRFANRAYRDWFGLDNEKMRGKHISEIIGAERFALNLPYIQGALSGERQVFERTIVDPQGVTRYSLAVYEPDIQDGRVIGFYAFVNDITPVRQAQQARSAAESMLRGVIDGASAVAIISTDVGGTIRVFSAGAERITGYRAHELVGRASPVLLHDAAEVERVGVELSQRLGRPISGFEVFVATARLGQSETREWIYVRKDGSRVPVSLVVTPVRDEAGELIGFVGVAQDITVRQAAERELRAASDVALAASRAKSEFVANMSHELRTPMNAVLGLAHLLGKTALTEEQRKYLDMLRGSGQSLLAILNDILDFSKIEAGRMELVHLPYQLDEVLDNVGNIMSVAAGERALELVIDVDPDVPALLVGDALRLQQVLVNLTGNAIKFTEQGQVLLKLRFERDGARGPTLLVDLRDTGIGMSEEQMTHLFAPFAQADASVTRRFGGTGLGLSITHRLVGMMGGSVRVDSSLGKGSTFHLALPVSLSADSAPPLPPARRLLVADAQPATLACLHHCAAALGWTLLDRTGLDDVLASLDEVDAVVANACLLEDDAKRTALAQACAARKLPLLAMANAGARERLLRGTAATQIAGFVQQPATRHALLDAVTQALERGSQAGGSATPTPAIASPAPEQRCDGAEVLLVEDNQVNQLVAREALEQAGAHVTLAPDGAQAIALLRAAPQRYDVVLMDVQMPVMDGFSATHDIRTELQLDVPVVAMTAGVLGVEREQCLASGMNDFLAKPIEVAQLQALVRRYWLQARLAAAAGRAPAQDSALFDPRSLAELGAGNAEFQATVRGLVRQMIEAGLSGVAEAEAAWQAGDSESARQLMHTMRGSIGTLGARQMHHASLVLEQALRDGKEEAIRAAFARAHQVRAATLATARIWLAQEEGAAASLPAPV